MNIARLLRAYSTSFRRPPHFIDPTKDYLYGRSVVSAALQSTKRELFALYHQESRNEKSINEELLERAKILGLTLRSSDKHTLNMMVDNRPHQGLVLEASPLDPERIQALGSIEDEKYNVGKEELSPRPSHYQPLWLALDSIHDPQNLGAILRSAYYFGVDGVVICDKNSAPLSPVASKASSGCLEIMDNLYVTRRFPDFLSSSRNNGWKVYTTISPLAKEAESSNYRHLSDIDESVLRSYPSILVLGNEGAGVRHQAAQHTNYYIGIQPGNSHVLHQLDSLNVSVATGVALNGMMQMLKR